METARHMLPGEIMDMYNIRMKYDIQVNGGKIQKRRMGM